MLLDKCLLAYSRSTRHKGESNVEWKLAQRSRPGGTGTVGKVQTMERHGHRSGASPRAYQRPMAAAERVRTMGVCVQLCRSDSAFNYRSESLKLECFR
jgi:hypothetical protein